MKPQLPRTFKHPGAEPSPSLQEELVAAIRGAFEVAVEMAVVEVIKLVGQATGGVHEEMRQENESLKRRLWRAEGMLRSARMEGRGGGSSPRTEQHPDGGTDPCAEQPPRQKCSRKSPDPKGGKGDGRRSDPPPDLCLKELSPGCVVRVESVTRPRHDDNNLPSQTSLPRQDDDSAAVQVTVKQEKPEVDRDGSPPCLDSIKEQHFNSACLVAAQSERLAEWKPEALDIQSRDSVSPLLYTRLAQAHPPSLIANLSPPTRLPSLSSELPEAPPHVSGVNLRTGRNLDQTYTCKYCGQTFQLPSLLRRHYSQCQQKCYQQPVAGSRKTKLQLYPPGFSPFRCTVCNREFNRMENLKTHLRIHTGERPFTCQVCAKCFRHSGALTRHFRIHTGEMPYICGQCGKSFRNCGGLKFHQRSHSMQLQ